MMKRGLLSHRQDAERLAAFGRRGDSMLVHVTPREVHGLLAMGGSGSKNPKTGLLEFFSEGDGPDGTGQESGAGAAAGGPGSSTSPDDSISSIAQGVFGGPASMVNPQPAAVPFSVLGGPIGIGVQTALSGIAQGIGQGINAVTGATNAGAVAGQGVVGTGGVPGVGAPMPPPPMQPPPTPWLPPQPLMLAPGMPRPAGAAGLLRRY